jgi:hypothetical protein
MIEMAKYAFVTTSTSNTSRRSRIATSPESEDLEKLNDCQSSNHPHRTMIATTGASYSLCSSTIPAPPSTRRPSPPSLRSHNSINHLRLIHSPSSVYIFHVTMQLNSSNHNNHPPEPSDYIPADTPVDSASVAASDTAAFAFVAVGARTVGVRVGCSRVVGRRGVGIWIQRLVGEGYWMVWGWGNFGKMYWGG